MSDKKKTCPIQSDSQGEVYCNDHDCMAWREIDHNDWDCVLIRGKK